jgi:hypothetical protein
MTEAAQLVAGLLGDQVTVAGRNFSLQLNAHAWPAVLKLAESHGWAPPRPLRVLTKSEAAEFAAALESALDDIPDEPLLESRRDQLAFDPGYGVTPAVTPVELFSGTDAKAWLGLVRAGPATIT